MSIILWIQTGILAFLKDFEEANSGSFTFLLLLNLVGPRFDTFDETHMISKVKIKWLALADEHCLFHDQIILITGTKILIQGHHPLKYHHITNLNRSHSCNCQVKIIT